jgi:hypothetical protein
MSDDWMTPQLRQLTAQFNAAVAEATQASREASATARAMAATDVTTSPEYRRLERRVADYFRSGRCGQAVRDLQDRVDRGELTWQQIRDGDTDPEATRIYLENQDIMLAGIATVRREDPPDPGDDPPRRDDPDDDGPVFGGVYKRR